MLGALIAVDWWVGLLSTQLILDLRVLQVCRIGLRGVYVYLWVVYVSAWFVSFMGGIL